MFARLKTQEATSRAWIGLEQNIIEYR